MKNLFDQKGKRLLAIFLCLIMITAALPANVLAWSASPGSTCTSGFGSYLEGYDGGYYYSAANYNVLFYNSDGSTYIASHSSDNARRPYLLYDSSGSSRRVFCIESGVYLGSDRSYTSDSYKNSAYFNMLPESAQFGIMLATMYGYQPGKAMPISGINADDYWYATQIICWEYQQVLRTSPAARINNGTIDKDTYYNSIKGRPAELAYNWILSQMQKHATVPSFTNRNVNNAPTHTLKYNISTGLYELTLTDTNGLGIDLERLSGSSSVTVTRSGSTYKLTTPNMISSPIRFEFRKNVPITDNMLIWGYIGEQTLCSGFDDPVSFYMNIRTETTGIGRIVKTSEDNIVSGIQFRVTGNGVDQTVTTGTGGQIELELMPGTYTVTETAPDRYVSPKSQTVTVYSGNTSTVYFSNILKKFTISASKVDSSTGTPQGNASLAGAVYGVFKGGSLVDTYTTDSRGQFTTKEYICGNDWTVQELEPSEGYELDTRVHSVGAAPGNFTIERNTVEMTLKEDIIVGRVAIVKHADEGETGIDTPEKGAIFEFYLTSAGSYSNASPQARFRGETDADGYLETDDLVYGWYTVHQVSAGIEGTLLVPDFQVYVSQTGRVYRYILNNGPISAKVRVEKRDIDSNLLIPASGIGFRVYDPDGNLVVQHYDYPTPTDISEFFTNEEGWLMLVSPLPYGIGYTLVETQTASGYWLGDGEGIKFDITGEETVVTVAKHNKAQQGRIIVSKSGEVFASVAVNEKEELYQPIYEVRPMAGAKYRVYADEDIYTLDGTLRASKDEFVSEIVTGPDGSGASDNLYLGRYRVEEVQAPDNMVLNPEPRYVELTYAGQEYEFTETETSFYNERPRIELDLTKLMEEDERFGVGMNDETTAVTFGLFSAEDMTAADGSVIPADSFFEAITVDLETGYGAFTSDLPVGYSYYVKELTTNLSYQLLRDAVFPVEFLYEGQDVHTVHITLNGGEPIINELIRGRIEGHKVDEDGNALAGAVFGLFSPDEETFTKENAILTAESDAAGLFVFEDVVFGQWAVRELVSPEAFVLSEEIHYVTVSKHGAVITVDAENRFITGNVQLTKVDEEYLDNKLSGATFEIWRDVNEDGILDDNDIYIGILEETDLGIYEMFGLRYGHYLLRETEAPAGFYLEETVYALRIVNDGETVVLQNVEGVGFINNAQYGALKIIKHSSDGTLEGFSFRIEGKTISGIEYSEVFTTDARGEIFVDLRIGEYTVSEVADNASARYVLPADQVVEIVPEETLEITFENIIKDTPKTGDDSLAWLWITLMAVSLGGIAVTLLVGRRLKKRTDSSAR